VRFIGLPLPTQPGGGKANQRLSYESGRGIAERLAQRGPQPIPYRPSPPPGNALKGSRPSARGDPDGPWRPKRPQGLLGESLIRFLGWPLPTQRRRERPLSESRKRLAGHVPSLVQRRRNFAKT
jgi:hypothetical protein